MPIKQDRVIELIQAAEHFKLCWEGLVNRVRDGYGPPAALEQAIQATSPGYQHAEVVAREKKHFALTKVKNELNARHMRRRRGKAGVEDFAPRPARREQVLDHMERQAQGQVVPVSVPPPARPLATIEIEPDPNAAKPEDFQAGVFGKVEFSPEMFHEEEEIMKGYKPPEAAK